MTVEDARLKAKAARARPPVAAALSARERVVAEQEAAVPVAGSEVAKASRQMALYGAVGDTGLGLSVGELHSLARWPSRATNRSHGN